jgi:hypothetical protein
MGYPIEPGRSQVQSFLAYYTALNPTEVGFQHYTIHAWEDTFQPYNAVGMLKTKQNKTKKQKTKNKKKNKQNKKQTIKNKRRH